MQHRAESQWLYFKEFSVYLRSGPYRWDRDQGKMHLALGVSNINVKQQYQRQGIFSKFINHLEQEGKALGYYCVRVEQVVNECLCFALERRGYTELEGHFPPTYEKLL